MNHSSELLKHRSLILESYDKAFKQLSERISVEFKNELIPKLMDESDKRDMKMSEYVLFILETHWNNHYQPYEDVK